MLPRVVQPGGGNLRELARALPPGRSGLEGVREAGDVAGPLPVGQSRRIATRVWRGGGAVGKGPGKKVQALVVAVPSIRLCGEGVGRIRSALVMAMNLRIVSTVFSFRNRLQDGGLTSST